MKPIPAMEKSDEGKALHGTPSEVSWDDGNGRQPYTNQEDPGDQAPHAGTDYAEGDRGELSGQNQRQLEQVKKKP